MSHTNTAHYYKTIACIEALVIAALLGAYILPKPPVTASIPSFLQYDERSTHPSPYGEEPGIISPDDGSQNW